MGQFTSGDLAGFEFNTRAGKLQLTRDVVYVDNGGKRWVAPKGMQSDGTSMPRILWPILGHPFTGKRLKPALIHDSAYQCAPIWDATIWKAIISEDRRNADDVFLNGMFDEGDIGAPAVHRGVRLGGWWAWYRHARRNLKAFLNGDTDVQIQ